MTAPVLEVADLRKTFGVATAVDGVSFCLGPGESLAIIGESGSGKTTVARMIVGLESPTAGRITVCGKDRSAPARTTRERRRRGRDVQMVFQDPYLSLDPRQTPTSAIDEVLRIHTDQDPRQRSQRAVELASLVGLDDRQFRALPADLSGGQRQRVAIARAIAAEPQVLILDESVAALDVSIQAQVLNVLADVRAQTGVAFLFITHDLAVIRHVADRVAVMKEGAIVEVGDVGSILNDPQHPYTVMLRDSVPSPDWRPRRQFTVSSEEET